MIENMVIIKEYNWYSFAHYYFAHAVIHGIVYDIVKQNENGYFHVSQIFDKCCEVELYFSDAFMPE